MTRKLGIVDIPKEVEKSYWERMRTPSEFIRYLLIDYYSLDTDFFFHAYEESDVKDMTDAEKMKHMFENYFKSESEDTIYETLLLIDVKTMKAYTITKEIKYTKKEVK
jgi:hypothetical protein